MSHLNGNRRAGASDPSFIPQSEINKIVKLLKANNIFSATKLQSYLPKTAADQMPSDLDSQLALKTELLHIDVDMESADVQLPRANPYMYRQHLHNRPTPLFYPSNSFPSYNPYQNYTPFNPYTLPPPRQHQFFPLSDHYNDYNQHTVHMTPRMSPTAPRQHQPEGLLMKSNLGVEENVENNLTVQNITIHCANGGTINVAPPLHRWNEN